MIVIDKKGNVLECESVDAKELISSGEYTFRKDAEPQQSPEDEAKAESPKAEKSKASK